MSALSELQVRDRLMHYFIRTDPLEIVLHRPTRTTTAAGGVVQTAVDALDSQTFHIYPFKRRLTQEYTHSPQTFGEERVEKILWIMIFDRGADIQINDYFDVPTDVVTDRILPGRWDVVMISARLWDRGQSGLMYRG